MVVGLSAANTYDSEGLKPMVEGYQTRHDPHRGRYFKPHRMHADKAYEWPVKSDVKLSRTIRSAPSRCG